MTTITTLILSISLAMDAFAVSIAIGLNDAPNRRLNAKRCGIAFGFFQAGMLMLGWLLGQTFAKYIEPIDHWVAFILLCVIGGKMIAESFSEEENFALSSYKALILLAIATSIDACAAGISISALSSNIIMPAVTVGLVTLILSYTGVMLGSKIANAKKIKKYADIFGGSVLIIIGTKILIEHLFF